MSFLRGLVTKAFGLLEILPSVNFKVVQLAALDALTLGWGAGLCFVKDTGTNSVPVFNAWLLFLAALHSVNLGALVATTHSLTTTAGGQQIDPPPSADGGEHRKTTTTTTSSSTSSSTGTPPLAPEVGP